MACAGFFKAKAVVPIPIEAQARESEPVKRLSLFKEAVEILRQGESHVVPLTWGYSGGMMDYRLQNFYVPGSEQIVKHFEHLWWDLNTRVFSVIGVAFPTFWLGILIVYALATFFQWLPPLGYATVWDDPLLNLQQLIFPALTLAFHDLAFTARVTRSSMLEVMREDYMRTARAKGLREILVVGRHALKNALLPVVTVSGYQFGRLLGGVIIVESIFAVPGMGTLLIDSIVHRDFIGMLAPVVRTVRSQALS